MRKVKASQRTKRGPGEYIPDTAYQRVEDLPKPEIMAESRNVPWADCPRCGQPAVRKKVYARQWHDLGDLRTGRPRELRIEYSQHRCSTCGRYFNVDLTDISPPLGHYTHRVMQVAIRRVVEDGQPYRDASWSLWRDYRVFVPFATIQNWVEAGGEKGG